MVVLSEEEVKNIREGGKIWQNLKSDLLSFVKPGISGREIDIKASELFEKYNVESAFYEYNNFPGHICVSVNDCIVHGVGNDIRLNKADKVTLDVGFKYKGLYLDSAFTFIVDPDSNPEYHKFVMDGYRTLWEGIKAVNSNSYTGDISESIENFVANNLPPSYSIINDFVGHTIGRELHQKPHIFNKGYKKNTGTKLLPNQVICIEPMILEQPTGEFKIGENGFDILSKSKGVKTCHWEHMVLIKKDGIEVLTASEDEVKEFLGY